MITRRLNYQLDPHQTPSHYIPWDIMIVRIIMMMSNRMISNDNNKYMLLSEQHSRDNLRTMQESVRKSVCTQCHTRHWSRLPYQQLWLEPSRKCHQRNARVLRSCGQLVVTTYVETHTAVSSQARFVPLYNITHEIGTECMRTLFLP